MKKVMRRDSADAVEATTRARVARLLLERGPSTAAALGAALGLSPAAVRRHLDALLDQGAVTSSEIVPDGPRSRGRPARAFALTDVGRASFPHAYDDIATAALRFLAEQGGEGAVRAFAESRVAELETRYADRVRKAAPGRRADALAAALSEDGYAASVEHGQVCQHHCPVQHVAEEFPQLCEAETEVFSRLLGSPVLRLTTIAHGDTCCTARVDDQPAVPTARTTGTAGSPPGRTTR